MTVLLKVHIWREENSVYMQVLEQAEKLRCSGKLFETPTMELHSRVLPQLQDLMVFIRGANKGYNTKIVKHDCLTEELAKEYYQDLKNLFRGYKAYIKQKAIIDKVCADMHKAANISTLEDTESICAPKPEDLPCLSSVGVPSRAKAILACHLHSAR